MLGSRNGAAPERSSTDSSKCTLEMQELHIPERRSGETVKLQFVIFKRTPHAQCVSQGGLADANAPVISGSVRQRKAVVHISTLKANFIVRCAIGHDLILLDTDLCKF